MIFFHVVLVSSVWLVFHPTRTEQATRGQEKGPDASAAVILPCGRKSCYGSDSKFAGGDPVPFLPNQRCSCSYRCFMFNDCCDDFRATSKNYVVNSLDYDTGYNGRRLIDDVGVTCGLPRHLTTQGKQVRFADNVPPFYRMGSCPEEDAPELPALPGRRNSNLTDNVFFSSWPVVDTATGIVFDNIETALCHSKRPGSYKPAVVKGPLKYWPSFSILCDNSTTDPLPPDFNPFATDHSQKLLNQLGCSVELTDPRNPVMLPVSFCVPFKPIATVAQGGCVIGAELHDDACLMGGVEIFAIYPKQQSDTRAPPLFYRNIDCAKCSGFEDDEVACNFTVEGWRSFSSLVRSSPKPTRYSTLNTFRLMMDFSWQPDELIQPGFRDDFEQSPASTTCEIKGDVFIPFLGSCHQLTIKTGADVDLPASSLERNDSAKQNNETAIAEQAASKSSKTCFVEITKHSPVKYSILENGTLKVASKVFDPPDYKLNENGSITLRYCLDALNPSDDDLGMVHGERDVPIRDIISRFVTLGFMALSVVSLGVLLVVYGLFPQLRNLPGKVIMCLAANLMAALGGYAIGVLAVERIWYPLCFSMAVIIHFSFLAAFAFTTCLAFDVWRTFKNKSGVTTTSAAEKLFLRYNLFAWSVPALIVSFSIVVEFLPNFEYGPPRPRYSMPVAIIHPADFHTSGYHEHAVWVCWLMNRIAVLAYFKAPILVCLITNFVFFAMTIYQIKQASTHSVRAGRGNSMGLRRRLLIYLKLSTIMGLTWLFGFIAAATKIEALWIPFGLANSLQGFYVCLSFVFTKKVARLLRGWLAGEHRRQSIDPRIYASTNSAMNNNNTSTMTISATTKN